MNYFQLTKRFWATHAERNLSNNAISLYFYLLNINNLLHWQETFACCSRKIRFELNLSPRKFYAAREELSTVSLIHFRSMRGRVECAYSLNRDAESISCGELSVIDTSNFKVNLEANFYELQTTEKESLIEQKTEPARELSGKLHDDISDELSDNIYNNKTKTIRHNKTTKSLTPRQSVTISAASLDDELRGSHPVMEEAVRKWLDYKQSRRQSYSTLIGVRTFIARLENLSGGDPLRAERIVEQSVANNWAGIFRLSDERFGRQNGKNTENHTVGEDKTAFYTDL